MEQFDQLLTRIFAAVIKKVEGMRRTMPFSEEKRKRRAELLHWKMQLRKAEMKVVGKESMERRKREACLVEESDDIHRIKECIVKAIEKWNDVIKHGKEIRENELLDHHHSEIACENDDQRKQNEKTLSGIKKSLNKQHAFHCISRHVGKGEREGIKRTREVDENNKIIKTHADRESIEDSIIKCNEMHFAKAHNSIAHADRIYEKLRHDKACDKILDGRLNKDECDDERAHEFLQLLKMPNRRLSRKLLSIEEWEKVVKKSKKQSASSMFSKRTHAVCKCALGSERMTQILVSYSNMIIANRYCPTRWLKMLDAILGKGKGMIIGKLRTMTLIEADLQCIMRMHLDHDDEEKIESDDRFSKSNCGSRNNHSIETTILEKRLTFDNSPLSGKLAMCHLTDLQSCYDRQLANIGGIVEESVGRDRKAIKLITKVIPNWEHCLSTAFGVSEKHYGGENNALVGTGQGNRFSGDVCRDISCLTMRVIEKENLGMKLKSDIASIEEFSTAVLFVDDDDMITEGREAEQKMQRILEICNELHAATGGHIQNKKCECFAWH